MEKNKENKETKEKFIGKGDGKSLRSRTGTWFECKVRYQKAKDGKEKMATEPFVVDALSFTEAENRIIEEIGKLSKDFAIIDISRAKYTEIFFSDDLDDDKWFRARLAFITINERKNTEKRSYSTYLVQSEDIERAQKYIGDVMASSMLDYEVNGVVETKIMDVFEHHTVDKPDKKEKEPEEQKK